MRLEVLADNKGAVIYVLNRPEIYIGSTENNDIVIASAEVSKKHLKLIITDDKKCFVIDQGCTNGTYINDERIVPGRREEFKMLSSIRLGEKILLTLLDKDRGGDVPELPLREQFVEENKVKIADEDKTRVISLKTLQKTKTEKVKKKRLKKLEKELKKKKVMRQDKATLNRAIMMALFVLGSAIFGMKGWQAVKKKRASRTVVAQMKETQIMVDDHLEVVEENLADNRIPDDKLVTLNEITKHAEDVNCSLPDEQFFCKRLPKGSRKKNGAINLNGQIVMYIEQKEWMTYAQSLVSQYAELHSKEPGENEADEVAKQRVESAVEDDVSDTEAPKKEVDEVVDIDMMKRIAFLSFLKTHLQTNLPPDLQTLNLYFVFYTHVGSSMEVDNVFAMRGSALSQVNSRYSEIFFKFKKYDPYLIIKKLDRFYKLY